MQVTVDYDRTQVEVDGTIQATATLSNQSDREAPMVIVDLPIPGGFQIDQNQLEQWVATGQIAKYQVTARQAILYLRGLQPGARRVLSYSLRATLPVRVFTRPVQVYEYYDPQRRAASQSTVFQAD